MELTRLKTYPNVDKLCQNFCACARDAATWCLCVTLISKLFKKQHDSDLLLSSVWAIAIQRKKIINNRRIQMRKTLWKPLSKGKSVNRYWIYLWFAIFILCFFAVNDSIWRCITALVLERSEIKVKFFDAMDLVWKTNIGQTLILFFSSDPFFLCKYFLVTWTKIF